MVVLIACTVLGLSRAGVRKACKCGLFKLRDDTLDEGEEDCEFVLAGEGGAGAKYLVMRREGAEAGAEVARGGAGGGGGEVEHVPDCKRPFGGRGLRLSLACSSAFQR